MRAVAAIALLLAFTDAADAQETDEPMPSAAHPMTGAVRPARGVAPPDTGQPAAGAAPPDTGQPAAGAAPPATGRAADAAATPTTAQSTAGAGQPATGAEVGPATSAAGAGQSQAGAGPEQPSPTVAAPVAWVWPDEDDPKLARGAPPRRPWWRVTHPVPRFQLAYRRLWTARLSGGKLAFDAAELEYFPVSNLIRFGIEAEFGWAGGTYGQWYTLFGATLGVQYPARVTPFLEARVVAGLSGGSYLGQGVFSWMYQGGLEGGAEIYYARRFYVSLALGWTHPVYGAVDVAALMAKPPQIVHKTFSDDSFTFKIGLGL